ncbi:hypothetical protein [Chitinophaga sp. RAB17]|uniref:hypothetical protein n=1 Tax=Chitinophaga sp. RAB17 TaxID=3233049 RepID=UPI003F8F2779
MILTSQALNDLEQNTALKKTYASAGSWGQNKLMFLPIVILVFSAFALYFFYDLSKRDASYSTYSLVCGALILLSIVAIAVMQNKAKKKILENIVSVPVCIAKKVYGNDDTGVYYCIYTNGSKRHDIAFIEGIADKIFNIDQEPDAALRKKINNLFEVKLANTNAPAVLLPEQFTGGEKVYQKQFATTALSHVVAENDGKFAVLDFNGVAVPVMK